MQTVPAQRAVYVIPPNERQNCDELWLLLAAFYGLVNFKEKWYVKSDSAIRSLVFAQYCAIYQLFIHRNENDDVDIILIKIVDDILTIGNLDAVK